MPPTNTLTEDQIAKAKRVAKVWVDQDLCTGDGLCEEIAPRVFVLLGDGLSYVKDPLGKVYDDPAGAEGLADVDEQDREATIESAEECPGECIFLADADGNPIPLNSIGR